MSRTANLAGPRSRTGMVVLCLALTAGFAPLASAQEQPAFNEHAGTLPDGTAWLIRVPENWMVDYSGIWISPATFRSRQRSSGMTTCSVVAMPSPGSPGTRCACGNTIRSVKS